MILIFYLLMVPVVGLVCPDLVPGHGLLYDEVTDGQAVPQTVIT